MKVRLWMPNDVEVMLCGLQVCRRLLYMRKRRLPWLNAFAPVDLCKQESGPACYTVSNSDNTFAPLRKLQSLVSEKNYLLCLLPLRRISGDHCSQAVPGCLSISAAVADVAVAVLRERQPHLAFTSRQAATRDSLVQSMAELVQQPGQKERKASNRVVSIVMSKKY